MCSGSFSDIDYICIDDSYAVGQNWVINVSSDGKFTRLCEDFACAGLFNKSHLLLTYSNTMHAAIQLQIGQ